MAKTSGLAKGAAWVFALGVLMASAALAEPQAAAPNSPEQTANVPAVQPQPSSAYYIEFRVAKIGTYGHSYVVYGRLNAQGKPAESRYADLHPTGNYALMALGHVLPVPANTTWNPEVAQLPVDFSYRRKLNATQYKNLVAAIQRSRTKQQPYWNAITYNCNHYIAELAKAAGLRAPTDFLVSYAFVPALRDLNEAAAPSTGRRASPARASTGSAQNPL
jgi:hypothetical protein